MDRGGGIALCSALSYGELGAVMPEARGEYFFLSKLFHSLFGFMSGWVSLLVGFSAPIAASAIGFSEYFCRALPGLPGWFESSGILSRDSTGKFLSVAVIVTFTYIHSVGIKYGSIVQNVLTFLKIALILLLLVAGFSAGEGNPGNSASGGWVQEGFAGWKTIGLSLMWIMFAYSGWNASTYLGSEIKNPVKTVPWSLIIGTAVVIIGPRVYYSMAKDGLFFKSVARIHPRYKVPSNSILLQAVIPIIMILSGSFEQILTYMGFALGIFPVLAVLGTIILRKKNLSVLKLKGDPFVQMIYVVSAVTILILSFMERLLESFIALITVLTGIPVYFLFKKFNTKEKHESEEIT